MDRYHRSLQRLSRHAPAFAELRGVWEHTDAGSLWWDRYHSVLVRNRSKRATRHLFDSPYLRVLAGTMRSLRSGELRRWIGPIDRELILPPDAVIVRPYSRWTPVVISPREELVLKLFSSIGSEHKNEIGALLIAKEHGLDRNTQQIVDHGYTSAGTPWMTSRLAPNIRLKMATHWPGLSRLWFQWLREEGLPFLSRYYAASGLSSRSFSDARDESIEGLGASGNPDLHPLLSRLATLSPPSSANTVVTARIHGDLSPAHVHRTREGWRLIDWGDSRQGTVFRELLRGPWDLTGGDTPYSGAFRAWLAGQLPSERLPKPLARSADHIAFFYGTFLNTTLSRDNIRDHVLCSMVLEELEHGRTKKLLALSRLMG
jgi:hypothetical protein